MTDSTTASDRVTDGPLLDLHDQLVAAAAPRGADHHRRNMRLLAAAAAVIVLLGVGATVFALVSNDKPAAADVSVQKNGRLVTVSIDKDVSVAALERALEKAHVAVTVRGVPTGPALVNTFVGIIGPPDAVLTGGDGTSKLFATFRPGSKVVLELGVPAKPGQPYDVPPDATLPGEPFAGLQLTGRPLREVQADMERIARQHGATVQYRDADGQPSSSPDPGGTVKSAASASSRLILVFVG